MNKKYNGPSLFDDGFEVTYEADPTDIINLDKDMLDEEQRTHHLKNNKKSDSRPVNTRKEKTTENTKTVPKKKTPISNTEKIPVIKKMTKGSAPKAYGNRHIYNTSFYVIRTASIILSIGIILTIILDFFRGAAPYGDITSLTGTPDIELIAYLCVAGFIILFYGLLLLFSFFREKVVKRGRTYKLDMGKGIGTFISLYLFSYMSFIACAVIPDSFSNTGYTFINGVIGALDVFGSMHNILLGMCTAGVISCIARKNMN